jgi:hypothetical protein
MRMWRIGSASVLQTDDMSPILIIRSFDAYANWVGDCLQNSFGQFDSDKHLLCFCGVNGQHTSPLRSEEKVQILSEALTLHSFNGQDEFPLKTRSEFNSPVKRLYPRLV